MNLLKGLLFSFLLHACFLVGVVYSWIENYKQSYSVAEVTFVETRGSSHSNSANNITKPVAKKFNKNSAVHSEAFNEITQTRATENSDMESMRKNYLQNLMHTNHSVQYPKKARKLGHEGKVLIRILVGPSGFQKAELIETSGSEILDSSAVDQITQWAFLPAPIELAFVIPVHFKLSL